jgi:hypothetical protein
VRYDGKKHGVWGNAEQLCAGCVGQVAEGQRSKRCKQWIVQKLMRTCNTESRLTKGTHCQLCFTSQAFAF